jgi:hypothetical protein
LLSTELIRRFVPPRNQVPQRLLNLATCLQLP